MVAWNDARILDESRRLDRIVDAGIKQSRVDGICSFLLNAGFAVMSMAAFIMTGNPASFGFLAVPTITVAINGFNVLRKDKDKQD